jgi:CRP-like cAMP-binding protein
MRPSDIVAHRANRLLARIPPAGLARLARHLEVVPLPARAVLFEAGAPLRYAYFPRAGVICLTASMRSGRAQMATIGSEGCVGIETALGGQTATNQALVQIAGSASRVSVAALRATMDKVPALREALLRYVRFFLVQALQAVTCATLHEVGGRCAQWLLRAHDRAGAAGSFQLTQELLAEMLGVHRPSVTIVARSMQRAGLIRYSRGVIEITNRRGLEETACECYGIVRGALDEILPPVAPD